MSTNQDNRIVQAYLFFNGNCEEAVEFYRQALGAEVEMIMRFKDAPDAPPPGMLAPGYENKVMHTSFRIGQTVVNEDNGRSGVATEATLDNDNVVEVLTWLQGMQEDGLMNPIRQGPGEVDQFLALGTQAGSMLIETSTASVSVEGFLEGSLDAGDLTEDGRIPTGLDVLDWVIRGVELGAGEILLTSMDADGTLGGYDLELTRSVAEAVSVPVIASGGAGKLEDFKNVFELGKADAALAASLFHDGILSIPDLKTYLAAKGVPTRI